MSEPTGTVATVTENIADQLDHVADLAMPELQRWSSELLEYVQAGTDFAAAQAPIFVEEIITWGIVDNSLGVLCLLGLATVCGVVSKKAHKIWVKKTKDNTEYYGGCADVVCIASGIFATAFAFLSVFPGSLALKAIVAPRLYVVDYLSKLF